MKRISFFVLCALSAFPLEAQTQSPGPSGDELSLQTVLKSAQERNPAVQAYREKWRAAIDRVPQARSLPDPTAAFVTMTDDLQTRAGPMMEQYSISQRFPFWGKRGLKGDVAQQDALMAEQAYRSKSLEVFDQVTRAYYEIFYLDQVTRVNEELADQLRHFAKVAERKYAVGKQSQASVFRAQIELTKVLNDLITLKQERASALARLNTLLDQPPRSPATPGAPQDVRWDWSPDDLEKVALEKRPEVLAAQALVEKSGAARRLALREFFPDLTVGYERDVIGEGTTDTPFDGQDAQLFKFEANLPVWYNRLVPQAREAKAEEKSAEALRKDWINDTLFEVEDRSVKVETAKRLAELYGRTVLPQAEEALASSQRGYEADQVPFLDLLDSVRSLLKFEQDYYRALADYGQRRADLERVLGVPLSEVQGGSHEK